MLKVNNDRYITQKSPNFKGLSLGPKARKAFDTLGNIKSPGQRLIFGVSALAIHPVMDKMNPWVDEKTKETSAIRSAAKAIACTVTGVIIREGCILGTDAILNNKNLSSKLPKYMLKDKNHTAAVIGTLMGLGVMMFTNFIIDVPLCNKLTTIFTKMRSGKNAGANKAKTPKETTPAPKETAVQNNPEMPGFSKNTEILSPKAPEPRIANPNTLSPENSRKEGKPPISQVNMEVLKWA